MRVELLQETVRFPASIERAAKARVSMHYAVELIGASQRYSAFLNYANVKRHLLPLRGVAELGCFEANIAS